MDHCGRNIQKAIKMTLLGVLFPVLTFAQSKYNQGDIIRQVQNLLENYSTLAGDIRPDASPDPVRPFIQLFYNPRVLVYDDLNLLPGSEMISIRDYSEKIRNLFSGGLEIKMNPERVKIGKFIEEGRNRVLVEVILNKTIEGLREGVEYRHSRRMVFLIGFDNNEGQYSNFLVHGIRPAVTNDHDILLNFSPSRSRIMNAQLLDDPRFSLPWENSLSAGLHYHNMFGPSWGFGTGMLVLSHRHSLLMDKFDAIAGHDPHLEDIKWSGEFLYAEMPFYGLYRFPASGRFKFEAKAGFFAAYRYYEEILSSAVNAHSSEQLTGVVTDPFNYENIARFDFGLKAGTGIYYILSKRLSLNAGASFRQGLFTLSADPAFELPYGIYQGQFNPMFYKTGRVNFSQLLSFDIGLAYRISGSKLIN